MAKLRVNQTIVNDNYTFVFSIDPTSISDDDMARVKKFGAPSINFGGTFTNGEDITYDLPNIYFAFPNDFPVTQSFTIGGSSPITTEEGLDLYRTTMSGRIQDDINTLRAIRDDFTGEYITNI